MSKSRKTTLILEVNANEWHVQYTGSIKPPTDKDKFKHDARIMMALNSSDELLDFFYRLIDPVIRYKRRKARKAAKQTIK